ncbi:MAG: tryptophan 7-halogenase [Thermoanaerobaculia bacterium]|nr:tryptophan 7-halogenase [Thermoanaerobaculia bacterium]
MKKHVTTHKATADERTGSVETDFEVVVAGGGPAGSTAATILAQLGHSVLLVERSAEPEFRIGESLMPATYDTLKRLGLLEAMRESRFPAKHSVQFFSGKGSASAPFYFSETDLGERAQTWQVLRSEFDPMLRDNASRCGVTVEVGSSVREVLFDDAGRAGGVRLRDKDGERLVTARVVVDATGQSTLIARKLSLREEESELERNVSYFTHFAGAHRDAGRDEGATLIYQTQSRRSWLWFIPLPGDHVSVGVVGSIEHMVSGRGSDPQSVFEQELADCPALAERLESARQVRSMSALKDYSYRSRQLSGDGWVLVGDAFGFLDPIYSTGVFLALASGEMAADAIHAGLNEDDVSAASLGRFESTLTQGVDALKQLVRSYYDPDFSFGAFLRRYPNRREDLVDMLVGRVFERSPEGLLADLEDHLAVTRVERAS